MDKHVSTEASNPAVLRPTSLTPEQEDLCQRLDQFYKGYQSGQNASGMFRGAVFAARPECRSNPDWMAQTAHSLREILYPVWEGHEKKKTLLKQAGSVTAGDERVIQEVGRVYGRVTRMAHHEVSCSDNEFEELLNEFERAMRLALTRQLDIHNEIDRILDQGVKP